MSQNLLEERMEAAGRAGRLATPTTTGCPAPAPAPLVTTLAVVTLGPGPVQLLSLAPQYTDIKIIMVLLIYLY